MLDLESCNLWKCKIVPVCLSSADCSRCGWNCEEAERRLNRIRTGDLTSVKPGLRTLLVYSSARPGEGAHMSLEPKPGGKTPAKK